MSDKPQCKIVGCERPVRARGWCASHYNRWHLTGDPGPVAFDHHSPVPATPQCKVEGCTYLATGGRGWCKCHYNRWYQHGQPGDAGRANTGRPAEFIYCKLEGCQRGHHANGYCATHYQRSRKYGGDPVAEVPIAQPGGQLRRVTKGA